MTQAKIKTEMKSIKVSRLTDILNWITI